MSSRPPVGTRFLVANPTLELRKEPDHAAEWVTEVPMGSELVLLRATDDLRWLEVSVPDGYRAWARSWGTCRSPRVWPGRGLYVSSIVATVHQGPSAQSPVLLPVGIGCRLKRLASDRRGWRKVATPDRRSGWIRSGSVESDSLPAAGGFWNCGETTPLRPTEGQFAAASLPRLLSRGRRLLGTAYRWGGVSPGGLDCSGLIRLLFGLEGISLPRDAHDQANALQPWQITESAGRLRVGDLVFFGERRGRLTHVGLGVGTRPGRILHARGRVEVVGLAARDRLFDAELGALARLVVRPPWSTGSTTR